MTDAGPDVCVCGHARTAHEHYRPGSDCALCADGGCRGYRSAGRRSPVARLLSRLRRP